MCERSYKIQALQMAVKQEEELEEEKMPKGRSSHKRAEEREVKEK